MAKAVPLSRRQPALMARQGKRGNVFNLKGDQMDGGDDSPPGRKIVRTTYAGSFLDRGGPSLSYRKGPKN